MNKKILIAGAFLSMTQKPSFERLEIREDEYKFGNRSLLAGKRSKGDRKRQPRWPR